MASYPESRCSRRRSVDSYDLVYPPTEVGGIFITTYTASTVGQVMKPCPDKDSTFPACKTKKPIYSGGLQLQRNDGDRCAAGLKYPSTTHCMEYTWCPKFGQVVVACCLAAAASQPPESPLCRVGRRAQASCSMARCASTASALPLGTLLGALPTAGVPPMICLVRGSCRS